MNLPPTTSTGPVLLIDARTELERLEQEVTRLRRQIQRERKGGPPDRGELEASVTAAHEDVLALETEVTRLREFARRRKDEISGWKDWYAAQDPADVADVAANLERLNAEIAWRATEISASEAEIQLLLKKLIDAEGTFAHLSTQLAAFDAGAYKAPLDEDPRLRAAVRARDAARRRLDRETEGARPTTGGRKRNAARFEIEVSSAGQLEFKLRAPNGHVLLTSGGHPRTADLLEAIAAVRVAAASDQFKRRESSSGEHFFLVVSPDGAELARSRMYSSRSTMDNGVRLVETNAPSAAIHDLT